MQCLSNRFLSLCGLITAVVLPALAGLAKADEARIRDSQDSPAFAFAADSDETLAQAGPSTKGPSISSPTVNPKTPPKPKTPPPKPPVSPYAEAQPRPSEAPTPPPNPVSSIFGGNAPPAEHLAGTPNMFGDLFNNMGGSVSAFTTSGPIYTALADLPLAAASRRVKIAEDDNALPQDRVFFLYNHFENCLDMHAAPNPLLNPVERSFCVDRYTFCLEKTFLNRCWSVELRMPLAGETDFSTPTLTPGFGVSGGSTGNLAVIVKRSLYESDDAAVTIGMGIDTPTGSDAEGFTSVLVPKYTFFTMHNDAVHLLPFAGFVRAPNDRFFYQGFIQADIAANGNRIDYQGFISSTPMSSGPLGVLNEQNLLYLDLSGGYWLYRNHCACSGLTGLAALLEFHYTTALQDTDVVQQAVFPAQMQLTFENFANRVDIVDLTVGLHMELANCTVCRVGAVFPLSSDDNRCFESEVQFQLERRF